MSAGLATAAVLAVAACCLAACNEDRFSRDLRTARRFMRHYATDQRQRQCREGAFGKRMGVAFPYEDATEQAWLGQFDVTEKHDQESVVLVLEARKGGTVSFEHIEVDLSGKFLLRSRLLAEPIDLSNELRHYLQQPCPIVTRAPYRHSPELLTAQAVPLRPGFGPVVNEHDSGGPK